MRELTEVEVDKISGGAINFLGGGIGALAGGLVSGAVYAANTQNFSWGQFAMVTGRNAMAGFLIGTGAGLIVSGVPGYATLGAPAMGLGAAIGFSGSVQGPASGSGGGSQ